MEQAGQVLGRSLERELRLARGWRECAGLSREQLEDIYQDTVLALLSREHASEEHLVNALRVGVRKRALRAHRDARRHLEILREHGPGMERVAWARQEDAEPERRAIASEEREVLLAFVAGLSPVERAVFAVQAIEGVGYRAAGDAVGVDRLVARRAARAAAGRGERFRAGVVGRRGWLAGVAAGA